MTKEQIEVVAKLLRVLDKAEFKLSAVELMQCSVDIRAVGQLLTDARNALSMTPKSNVITMKQTPIVPEKKPRGRN